MRFQGKLTEWNDEKGYGFVEPNGGGARAFVHIKSFDSLPKRPVNGDLIIYETTTDQRNRLQAVNISFTRVKKTRKVNSGHQISLFNKALLLSFWVYLIILVMKYHLPPVVPFAIAVLSVITFFTYALDKQAAQKGNWRTKESTLHLLALIGGWPGAMYAQQKLRHKSVKTEFRETFWVTVVVNISVLSWVSFSETGRMFVRQLIGFH